MVAQVLKSEGTFLDDIGGMLPLTKTTEHWNAWHLPGHGSKRSSCGEYRTKGCLAVSRHNFPDSTFDASGVAKPHFGHRRVAVFKTRRSCGRSQCPECFEKWASMEAHRAMHRFDHFATNRRLIHVVISVSQYDMEHLGYKDLRSKMYEIAKEVGISGGLAIIHPFRNLCRVCNKSKHDCKCGAMQSLYWYISPHFHLLCYGWVKGDKVGESYARTGWTVMNLGVRQSPMHTIFYQLSHAGVNHQEENEYREVAGEAVRDGKKATIVWFGDMSYNKLKIPKFEGDKICCPLCGEQATDVQYGGDQSNLDALKEGEWSYLDPGGWSYA